MPLTVPTLPQAAPSTLLASVSFVFPDQHTDGFPVSPTHMPRYAVTSIPPA